ncbi:MAG: lipoyl(octanoyl) transferase LipB [Gemmatimonadetes bacterium]|nr:lipoyl(octanoyl) transferase LipB [Gemmatimonadota bacterium]
MSTDLAVVGLGRMDYGEALELQRTLALRRIEKSIDRDLLLLVEHPPVVTLGRGFRPDSLPLPREFLEAKGIEIFEIDRGGDVTFHGPGQLVGYPIFDLSEHRPDLHWFLRRMEQALIVGLSEFGIPGGRREGYTGVWTGGRKIASIGIHVKQWVTWHGFALNVATELSYFDLIVPCGIPDVVMTSIHRELGERAPRDLWSRSLDATIVGFSETFGQRPQAVLLEELLPTSSAASPSSHH